MNMACSGKCSVSFTLQSQTEAVLEEKLQPHTGFLACCRATWKSAAGGCGRSEYAGLQFPPASVTESLWSPSELLLASPYSSLQLSLPCQTSLFQQCYPLTYKANLISTASQSCNFWRCLSTSCLCQDYCSRFLPLYSFNLAYFSYYFLFPSTV